MTSRCLYIGTWQMPICARCFGIILGFPFGLLIGLSSMFSSRWHGIIFCIPLLIDAGTQEVGYRESNNGLRSVTGLLAGVGLAVFLFLWVREDIMRILN